MNRLIAGLCICASLASQSMAGTAGKPPPTVIFGGNCDASAALPLGGNRLLVVDDESKKPLKIYTLERPSDMPQDMGKLVNLLPNTTDVEADLEALASLGDDVVFIASHNWHAKREKMAARQLVGCTPYSDDNSARALSPDNAAVATCALNCAPCCLRITPMFHASSVRSALAYPTVRKTEAAATYWNLSPQKNITCLSRSSNVMQTLHRHSRRSTVGC